MGTLDRVESVDTLDALRETIARIERQKPADAPDCVPLGVESLDRRLGGGLARGRLHELFAAEPADAGSAGGFAAMLACRMLTPGAPLLWLRLEEVERRGGRLHPPGLAEIGLDPGRLVLAVLPDPVALLRAAAEVMRCPEVGVAVIELWQSPRVLDLTASRRLAVAAEEVGVTALLLRAEAEPTPSAAQTRWSISAAASVALEADAPGWPAFDVELLRQRGGPAGGRWRLEWNRDLGEFREPVPEARVGEDDASQTLAG
jgi:protein ImuA